MTSPSNNRVAVFSAKSYDRQYLSECLQRYGGGIELDFLRPTLDAQTASLAQDHFAVIAFVNDRLDASVIEILAKGGTQIIAMRCAGYNNVDLEACKLHGIRVVRVPAYSPHGVAEHTVGLMLALNRRIPRAVNRVREGNFELAGLLGFNMHGRTAGVIGTGKIGECVVRILLGMGCKVLVQDKYENPIVKELGATYVERDELLSQADIVTLHCPLTPETYHLIDGKSLKGMKSGVMIINTSRGALLDTSAVLDALKDGKVGYLGLDVYEEEGDLFFRDLSDKVITDDVFARLLTFPNVIVTGHQAFFTQEALANIADDTITSLLTFHKQGAEALVEARIVL
jgi:D-lactate dehydrogenase